MTKSERAEQYFRSGYNCAQAVIAAFSEDFGVDVKAALKISEGFGGGIGRMRSVCGAASGMFMAIGLAKSNAEPKDTETRADIYAAVQKAAAEFERRMGSYICADLLGGVRPAGSVPTERDAQFYKKRPCVECVRAAAEIAEELLQL